MNNSKSEVVYILLKRKNMSVREFAKTIGVPYTTVMSILKNDLESASVSNVMKICKGLNITFDELMKMSGDGFRPMVTLEELEVATDLLENEKLREIHELMKKSTPSDFALIYDLIKRVVQ